MRAFTLMEALVVVVIIAAMIGIGVTTYRGAKWAANVTNAAAEQRGRINRAVAEGRIRDQETLDRELRRANRMTEQGLKN